MEPGKDNAIVLKGEEDTDVEVVDPKLVYPEGREHRKIDDVDGDETVEFRIVSVGYKDQGPLSRTTLSESSAAESSGSFRKPRIGGLKEALFGVDLRTGGRHRRLLRCME